jgi:hypothetical protein
VDRQISATDDAPATTTPAERPGDAVVGDGAFSYLRLLSAELRRYVANLRRVNVPETTVQDIILAEVNRRYAAREAALGVFRQHRNPWDPQPASGRDWSKWKRLRELREEKRAVVKDLLGIDLPLEMPDWNPQRNPDFEAALMALPEDKRGPARELLEKFRDRRRELEARTRGIYTPEDLEEFRAIRAERARSLTALLGKEALEKLEITASGIERSILGSFPGFELSGGELSGLVRAQLAMRDQPPGLVVGRTAEEVERDSRELQNLAQRYAQEIRDLRASMTPERQAEFDRAQDPWFQSIYRRASQLGMPRETAVQMHETTSSLRREIEAVMRENASQPERLQQLLREAYDRGADQLRQLVGEEAFNQMGGINRIPGLPRYAFGPKNAGATPVQNAEILRSYGLRPWP